ncbi:MAG: tRNA (guanosine(37)-N1)-methyltransferase TrmD [bacterium]|jgi:tRNA (guanine37-N1)-methyltransferase|nr:tRNA (guanosine(37)-N1)-methyltransferase TrmD [bacterium]
MGILKATTDNQGPAPAPEGRRYTLDIVTIFPGIIESHLSESLIKKARERGILVVEAHDLRNYTSDRHRTVDDAPYGGGAGMVMKAPPFFEAVDAITALRGYKPHTIMVTPQGRTLNQKRAQELAARDGLLILCGHYEGVDERVRAALADEEISLGDYVLMGGEVAAMAIVEAVSRLLPGVLGAIEAHKEESHYAGLLEYPHYTRPAEYRGLGVPEVLLSGNHSRIERWRRHEMLRRTLQRRPELLLKADLVDDDKSMMCELIKNRDVSL